MGSNQGLRERLLASQQLGSQISLPSAPNSDRARCPLGRFLPSHSVRDSACYRLRASADQWRPSRRSGK